MNEHDHIQPQQQKQKLKWKLKCFLIGIALVVTGMVVSFVDKNTGYSLAILGSSLACIPMAGFIFKFMILAMIRGI